jgi:hypothetical protein
MDSEDDIILRSRHHAYRFFMRNITIYRGCSLVIFDTNLPKIKSCGGVVGQHASSAGRARARKRGVGLAATVCVRYLPPLYP